nr:hypothetical protein [Morchella crassipes]
MLRKTTNPPLFLGKTMEKGEGCRSYSPPLFPNVRPRVACPPALPIISLRKYFPPPSLGPLGPGKREGGGRRGGDGHFFNKMTYPPPPSPPPQFYLTFIF